MGARTAGGNRGATGELTDLAGELASAMRDDRGLGAEAVAPDHVDRAVEHEPCRCALLPDRIDDLSRSEMSFRTACKAPGDLALRRIQYGEHLVLAGTKGAHSAFRSFATPVAVPHVWPERDTSRRLRRRRSRRRSLSLNRG